jgi:hypothetical protein
MVSLAITSDPPLVVDRWVEGDHPIRETVGGSRNAGTNDDQAARPRCAGRDVEHVEALHKPAILFRTRDGEQRLRLLIDDRCADDVDILGEDRCAG